MLQSTLVNLFPVSLSILLIPNSDIQYYKRKSPPTDLLLWKLFEHIALQHTFIPNVWDKGYNQISLIIGAHMNSDQYLLYINSSNKYIYRSMFILMTNQFNIIYVYELNNMNVKHLLTSQIWNLWLLKEYCIS